MSGGRDHTSTLKVFTTAYNFDYGKPNSYYFELFNFTEFSLDIEMHTYVFTYKVLKLT